MSLTADKREQYPQRYARKDARTAINRALYGIAGRENGKRSNDPALDETRSFAYHWTYQQAEATLKEHIDAAELSAAQRAHLERRLDNLRHYKPKA